LALNPDYAEAHQKLAESVGQPAEALEHWRETIRLRPNNAAAHRHAAWILATNQTLRDGSEALAMAARALLLANVRDSATLATLAAAYAEKNRFEDAIATARRAIAADPAQAQTIQRHIERYQAGNPWRE
jgi:tetratricopeptide (TPR) repeat protein